MLVQNLWGAGVAEAGLTAGQLRLDLLAVRLDGGDLSGVSLGLQPIQNSKRPSPALRRLPALARPPETNVAGRTSSLPSMDETILHDARRAPITFLYATERRFLSSMESSESSEAMLFIWETICMRGARQRSVRSSTTRAGERRGG